MISNLKIKLKIKLTYLLMYNFTMILIIIPFKKINNNPTPPSKVTKRCKYKYL